MLIKWLAASSLIRFGTFATARVRNVTFTRRSPFATASVTSGLDQSSAASGAGFQSKVGEICGLVRRAAESS